MARPGGPLLRRRHNDRPRGARAAAEPAAGEDGAGAGGRVRSADAGGRGAGEAGVPAPEGTAGRRVHARAGGRRVRRAPGHDPVAGAGVRRREGGVGGGGGVPLEELPRRPDDARPTSAVRALRADGAPGRGVRHAAVPHRRGHADHALPAASRPPGRDSDAAFGAAAVPVAAATGLPERPGDVSAGPAGGRLGRGECSAVLVSPRRPAVAERTQPGVGPVPEAGPGGVPDRGRPAGLADDAAGGDPAGVLRVREQSAAQGPRRPPAVRGAAPEARPLRGHGHAVEQHGHVRRLRPACGGLVREVRRQRLVHAACAVCPRDQRCRGGRRGGEAGVGDHGHAREQGRGARPRPRADHDRWSRRRATTA